MIIEYRSFGPQIAQIGTNGERREAARCSLQAARGHFFEIGVGCFVGEYVGGGLIR
jgi:hypothetical protein